MRTKYLLMTLATILVFTSALRSQDQTEAQLAAPTAIKSDTVIVNINNKDKIVIVERDNKGRTKEIVYYKRSKNKNRTFNYDLLFDIGLNTYGKKNYFSGSEGNDDFLDLHTSKSVNVAIYPIYGSVRLTKNRMLELETGLGLDWHNYRFEDGWTITKQNGVVIPSDKYRPNGDNLLSKSKLTTVHLNVPLLLKLNIPVGGSLRKSLYLSAGVIGGLKIGSHTKVKFSDGGKKEKERSAFNLNLLKYDLSFRAGYRGVGLYFNYQMSSMFEKSKGPELYPNSVGLSFTIW